MVLCPALTSHSEMSPERLKEAGITPTTIRLSVGDEDVRHLIAHFISVTELVLDPVKPDFSRQFMPVPAVDELYRQTYLSAQQRWFDAQPTLESVLS
jgi:O-acetylhomoserine (thiol)-lyase